MKLANRKKQVFPTKKTLNLMQKDKTKQGPYRLLLMMFLLSLLVFGVFKFGVFDRMYYLYSANTATEETKKQLEAVKAQTKDYDKVYEEYSRYTFSGFTEAELARVNRIDAIGLIDSFILTAGSTNEYTITDNTLAMSLSGVTLAQTSELLQRLYTNPMVESVLVSTAGSETGKVNTVNMTIVLKKTGEAL